MQSHALLQIVKPTCCPIIIFWKNQNQTTDLFPNILETDQEKMLNRRPILLEIFTKIKIQNPIRSNFFAKKWNHKSDPIWIFFQNCWNPKTCRIWQKTDIRSDLFFNKTLPLPASGISYMMKPIRYYRKTPFSILSQL